MEDYHDIADEGGSQFAHLLEELELYGRRPFEDDLDPRPLPEGRMVGAAAADTFDAMGASLADTRLEPEFEELLWGFTNVFHRAVERVDRQLDSNELAQKRSQREQDGTEVKSVELEKLIAEGRTMIERRDAMEAYREAFGEQFLRYFRKPWLPKTGSMLNRRAMTAAVIESREFVNDRRWADAKLLVPPGERVYVSGGTDYMDYNAIWQVLDKVHARHPAMVLIHGGSSKGAEHIAALWASERKVPQVPFKPDFAKHSRASAPFKRNDRVIAMMPRGIVIFPGGGIQDNLFDKARTAGIAVMDHRRR